MKQNFKRYFIWGAIFACAAYLGISYYILESLTMAGRHPLKDSAKTLHIPYEDITFYSRTDQIKLKGWFFPAIENRFTLIFVHGINTNRISNKHTLNIAKDFVHHGVNVFMFDMRAKGESEGKFSSGGFFEKLDVLGAFDYLVETKKIPLSQIGILGFSMGGATSILAVSMEPKVQALVVEAPYSDARKLIAQEAAIATGAPMWVAQMFIPAVKFFAKTIYQIKLDQMVPKEAVGKIQMPIFLIHGIEDTRLPPFHSKNIYKNAHKGSELWLVSETTHTDAYRTHPQEYISRLISYYEKQLQVN